MFCRAARLLRWRFVLLEQREVHEKHSKNAAGKKLASDACRRPIPEAF
jgi:hypothetical protein